MKNKRGKRRKSHRVPFYQLSNKKPVLRIMAIQANHLDDAHNQFTKATIIKSDKSLNTNRPLYQSSWLSPCIAFCLALKASANPPANPPPPPLGVLAPLPPSCCAPFACCPFEYPLSRGVGGGAGFLPAGRLAGGAGGVGLALVAGGAPPPFALLGVGGGGGRDAAAGAGGGGGGAWRTSSR